jgi:hypothetical protein
VCQRKREFGLETRYTPFGYNYNKLQSLKITPSRVCTSNSLAGEFLWHQLNKFFLVQFGLATCLSPLERINLNHWVIRVMSQRLYNHMVSGSVREIYKECVCSRKLWRSVHRMNCNTKRTEILGRDAMPCGSCKNRRFGET